MQKYNKKANFVDIFNELRNEKFICAFPCGSYHAAAGRTGKEGK
jgi:hypothetical protein